MIHGIGLDIVELDRIASLCGRQERFAERILTESEQAQYESLSAKRRIEFLAGRFAAKEAFSKAFGTGIGKHLSFQDIEVKKDTHGKPSIECAKLIQANVHVSITHTKEYAAAQVLIERLSS
ncbi:holo-ACP synthase [Bacillus atrophaeus]|uniref:holo-ACP synthase n=1 Tax=Bacillus atrophaeus TaxID=1452 RepID=UPI00228027C1|nr:holo-ACP synthase [Bacillus atrophaeus]MCY8839345.1 holo-ACP synthase [Bacillus atrophaeus]MEC5222338.1 holo-ACP synthase [Bacillus atrophaeus]MED4577913.1 holo-ACP synthase [Bacillus atrophaeus]MED4722169.1 holo-ACP synthase [Bacillus atrophaeus]MED4801447.1 holo-ACP synthase [Bacillus atrophaeus]